jgi:hypothetical protein
VTDLFITSRFTYVIRSNSPRSFGSRSYHLNPLAMVAATQTLTVNGFNGAKPKAIKSKNQLRRLKQKQKKLVASPLFSVLRPCSEHRVNRAIQRRLKAPRNLLKRRRRGAQAMSSTYPSNSISAALALKRFPTYLPVSSFLPMNLQYVAPYV